MTTWTVEKPPVVYTTFSCRDKKQSQLLELLLNSGRLDLQDVADLLETPRAKLLEVLKGVAFLAPDTSKRLAKWVLLLLQ